MSRTLNCQPSILNFNYQLQVMLIHRQLQMEQGQEQIRVRATLAVKQAARGELL